MKMVLKTNKYPDDKVSIEVELEVLGEEDGGIIVKPVGDDGGREACLKKLGKWEALAASKPLFVAAFLLFLLGLYYYSLYTGIAFTALTALWAWAMESFSKRAMIALYRAVFAVAAVVPIASFIMGIPVSIVFTTHLFFLVVFLISTLVAMRFFENYKEMYVLCEDYAEGYSALFRYLKSRPSFYYWRND